MVLACVVFKCQTQSIHIAIFAPAGLPVNFSFCHRFPQFYFCIPHRTHTNNHSPKKKNSGGDLSQRSRQACHLALACTCTSLKKCEVQIPPMELRYVVYGRSPKPGAEDAKRRATFPTPPFFPGRPLSPPAPVAHIMSVTNNMRGRP